MSTTYLRYRAGELERALKVRNFIEQGSCALALVYCAIMIFAAPDHWFRASMVMLLVGIGWALFQWRRRTRARISSGTGDTGIAFYIRELEHRRDLYKSLWRWYLLPMVPGAVVLLAWGYVHDLLMLDTAWIGVVGVIAWIIYEQYEVRQYQREIDALTAGNGAASSARRSG